MTEPIRIVFLGVIAAGILSLVVLFTSLRSQVDALRAEVAVARIEGVLGGSAHRAADPSPPAQPPKRLGLGLVLGAVLGTLTMAAAWLAIG